MSTYAATIHWQRGDARFSDNRFSRGYTWQFDGGLSVRASASPHIVPPPLSVPGNVDPEEAFVAALSSCHRLFYLSIAARRGVIVDEYRDEATGYMDKNAEGQLAMTRVSLRPRVRYGGGGPPSREVEAEMHHEAHQRCFIANSVRTAVAVDLAV